MKVVSLFDGYAGGRLALDMAGFKISRYVAFEIDPHAMQVSGWNWADIEQRGSVVGADFTEFEGFDIVMGGFPCTDLSIGKTNRQGLKGEHSKLFWEQVRAIKEIKPKYFLVENNFNMPKIDEEIITATLGVKPIFINSATLSGQTRKRLYWTNIPNVEAPEDLGITLRDILEDFAPAKYTFSEKGMDYIARDSYTYGGGVKGIMHSDLDKSRTLCSVFTKGAPYNVIAVKVNKSDRVADLYGKGSQAGRVYSVEGKSVCINAGGGGAGAKTGLYAVPLGVAFRTRNTEQGRYKKPEVNYSGKSNALTTVTTDAQVITKETGGHVEVLDGRMYYKDKTIPVKLPDGQYNIRKLTPLECERLQTLPDHYTEMVSDAQRYKMLGNGWTAKVIAHILNYININDVI